MTSEPLAVSRVFERSVYACFVGSLCLLLSGCASSFGPKIDRYKQPKGDQLSEASIWGETAWEAARNREMDVLLSLLRTPPVDLKTNTPFLVETYEEDVAHAIATRSTIAQEAMNTISAATTGDGEWLVAISTLADVWNAGVSPEQLSRSVELILRDALEALQQQAVNSQQSGLFEEAAQAWAVVSTLAADLGNAQLHTSARVQTLAASQPLSWNTEDFSIRNFAQLSQFGVDECIEIVDTILQRYVEPLDWLELSLAGFHRMARRASFANTGKSDLLQAITEAQLDLETQGSTISCNERTLCSKAKRLLRENLQSIFGANIAYTTVAIGELERAFIRGAFSKTDLHSTMIWPENVGSLRRALGDAYVGIGAQVGLGPDGSHKLMPMPGSPARQAGIEAGDRLTAIDGWSTSGQTIDEGVKRVIGPQDTDVTLTLERDGTGEPFDIVVTRASIIRPSVVGWSQRGINSHGEPMWEWLVDPSLRIAYLKITDFTDQTEPQFRQAINDARSSLPNDAQIEGMILDLRENGGGTKQSATRLADLFLDFGALCATQQSDQRIQMEQASARSSRLSGLPLVILMNERSASASELLAGALQGTGDAVVIGERSYGKGSAQVIFRYRNALIKVTTDWFAVPTPTGVRFIDRSRSSQTWGVRPNLEVPAANDHDLLMQTNRGSWHALRGKDFPPQSGGEVAVADSNDRALILGLALLEARLSGAASQ